MFCGPHNNYCGAGAAPAYTSDAGMEAPMDEAPMDTTGCNGQVVQAGSRTEYVDCPTTRTVPETYVVPRTVTGSRLETRTRTRNEIKQRIVPITKFRNETKMVPVSRQVAYTDYKTETYPVPVPETYTVTLPTKKIVPETRTRTKMIPGTKKCPVQVPVYSATCNAGATAKALAGTAAYDTGAPMDGTYDTSGAMPTTGALLGDTAALDMNAMNTPLDSAPLATDTQASGWGQWSPWSNPQPANMGTVTRTLADGRQVAAS